MNPAAKFLALTPARRNVAIEQAATQRAISPVIMEKDFWVLAAGRVVLRTFPGATHGFQGRHFALQGVWRD